MRASWRMPLTGRARVGLLFSVFTAIGCRSLDRFDTSGQAAYCGSIVGTKLFQDGFIPKNTPPDLQLHLELDVDNLTTRPGKLTSNDQTFGLCRADGQPLFLDASLRAIEEIFHDDFSQMEFGEGHQHDFVAWVDSSCQGTMVAIVSLLTNGEVEVRLMKPAADPPSGASAAERPGFAKFSLRKSETGCDF